MKEFKAKVEIRWSDLDPNFHLRHSVYYDWGAFVRLKFLYENKITPAFMQRLQFGPILFREECLFKREIVFGDVVEVNLKLLKSREDMSRWSIKHEIWKNNETLAAILIVDGAWMNTRIRKLDVPPEEIFAAFNLVQKDENFEWLKM